MSSSLKMYFRISLLLSCSSLLTTPLFAAPFASNDSASRAMGGTGVASSQTYASSYFNPSLLAADAGKKGFGMMLPSATVSFDDSSRLLQASRDYFESSYDIFSNYDVDIISTLINGEGDTSIIGSFDAVAAASSAVAEKILAHTDPEQAVDIDIEIDSLIAANDNLQTNMATMNTEITQAKVIVSDARAGLGDLSNRPIQANAGVAIAIAIPSKKWGSSLYLHNDLLTGVNFDIADQDTKILEDVITDFEGMVAIATVVAGELSDVVIETAKLTQIMTTIPESASWTALQWSEAVTAGTDQAARDELAAYATQLQVQSNVVDGKVSAAQDSSEDLETFEGNYVSGGELTLTEENRPELVSSLSIMGANIAEVGVSFARQFKISGEDINIGITPKFQRIDIFDHTFVVEKFIDESELEAMEADFIGYIQDYYTTKNTMNLDIGVSKDFTYKGNIRAGLVIKNLIAQTFTSEGGSEITIPTQIRVGVAHTARFTTFALDIDITENEALSFGEPTQYLALGAELNIFGHAKLRTGYRNNIAVQNGATLSAGLAFTPFGIGFDVSGWLKPTNDLFEAVQDAGVSVQLSAQF